MSGKTAAITNSSEVAVAESTFARAVRFASEVRVVIQLSRGMSAVVAFEARNGRPISTATATVLLRQASRSSARAAAAAERGSTAAAHVVTSFRRLHGMTVLETSSIDVGR